MKDNNKKKDIWFVLNAVALALIFLGVLHTLAPYIEPHDPNKPKVMDYAATIKLIKAKDIPPLLVSDKPTLLVVYASWCPTCRKKMPDIMAALRGGELNDVHTVFISYDKNVMAMARYLVQTGYYKDLVPYLYNAEGSNPNLVEELKNKGSVFKGGIPFTELYSNKGKALTFIPHYLSKDGMVELTKRYP